jgi:aminobenzoyl-glutamate utilization protein B
LRLAAILFVVSSLASAQITDAVRQDILRAMDAEAEPYAALSQQVWDLAEIGYSETKSSALIAGELRKAGFKVDAGAAGMPTAIVATWGQGKPVIAIVGEYDALPGLSQEASPVRKPVVVGGSGHGCGHNLFGVAALHAAVTVKRIMQERNMPGTLRFYGTPAEEGGGGKIHMIRAGLFKDVDAALTWHPWDVNAASNQNWLATVSGRFHFTGKASHAAAAPEAGRSALDAAMIMTHAVDLLREHVPQETRMHYILEKAGSAVNIVPDNTEVVLLARHPQKEVLAGIWERLLNCAQAGALATGTQMTFEITGSYANMLSNTVLTSVVDRNLRIVGGYKYTPEEQAFADTLGTTLAARGPAEWHETIGPVKTGIFAASTDVGDLSYNVPTTQFLAATWVPGTPAHTWQSTAASGTTIGRKGMMIAAKTLALSALDLLSDPASISSARAEFQKNTAGKAYTSLHPTEIRPR